MATLPLFELTTSNLANSYSNDLAGWRLNCGIPQGGRSTEVGNFDPKLYTPNNASVSEEVGSHPFGVGHYCHVFILLFCRA